MNKSFKFPGVSVIVVNFNGREYLEKCFSSLNKLDYPKEKTELITVDNCSADGSVEFMQKNFPEVIILRNKVNNYCMANNLGIRKSRGEYTAILNNDTEVDRDWLKESIRIITADEKIGAVGSKVLFPDGKMQSAGHVQFPHCYFADIGFMEEDSGKYSEITEVSSISNSSALYRKKAFKEVGFFDEDFGMYMEDVDMCFRLKQKGWKILFAPESRVYHRLHGVAEDDLRMYYIEKNRLLFLAKHSPEKLEANIAGYGDINKLDPYRLQNLLFEVFKKLVKHHGSKKAAKIMLGLDMTLQKVHNYTRHIISVEKQKQKADAQEVKNQREVIDTKTREIHDLAGQIDRLNAEIKNREERIIQLQNVLDEKNSNINTFMINSSIQDDKLRRMDEAVKERDRLIYDKQNIIEEKEKLLNELNAEKQGYVNGMRDLQDKNLLSSEREEHLKEDIKKVESQLLNVYASETYRFFVRPVLWPFLSFLKKITRPVRKVFKLKRRYGKTADICIAQLYAKKMYAEYLCDNEYIIKLVNNKFSTETIRLVFDIWPYHNRFHPERHFVYFAVEITLKPKDSLTMKLLYDWEKNARFYIGEEAKKILDFWRGDLNSPGLYELKVFICDREGNYMDGLTILQRLKK